MIGIATVRGVVEGRIRRTQADVSPSAAFAQPEGGQQGFSRRTVILQASAMWLVSRLVLVVVTYFIVMFSTGVHPLHTGYPSIWLAPFSAHALLVSWQRWDVIWYMNIAQRGYWTEQATAFFPLFPMLVNVVGRMIGGHWLVASMLVSNVGTLFGFIALGLLAAGEGEGAAATWGSIRAVAAYPLALFLFAGYTDGVFLALATGTLLFARRGSWVWAAVCAYCAALSRPTGLILVLPLIWEFGRQNGMWARDFWAEGHWRAFFAPRRLVDLCLVVGAVPAGILTYLGFLYLRFGHPLIFLHVEDWYWHHTSRPIWWTIPEAIKQFILSPMWTYWQARQLVDLVPVLLFGVLTVVSIRRVPFAFTLYMAGLLYLAIANPITVSAYPQGHLLISAGRYLAVAAPMFVLLGRWSARRPWLDLLIVSLGFMLQAVLTGAFLLGGWLV